MSETFWGSHYPYEAGAMLARRSNAYENQVECDNRLDKSEKICGHPFYLYNNVLGLHDF